MTDTLRPILIAEDDDDDFLLTCQAFAASHLANDIRRVTDGEMLLDYLLRRNAYTDSRQAPMPALILLDLHMPRKNGREALAEIKAHPLLRRIPVVMLTTSELEEDILATYDLGVSSYLRKPVTFAHLCDLTRIVMQYYLECVELPPNPDLVPVRQVRPL